MVLQFDVGTARKCTSPFVLIVVTDKPSRGWLVDRHLDGGDIRDLMAESVEARFACTQTPRPIEWLSDNGPPYTAHDTRKFGADCGFIVCNTPCLFAEIKRHGGSIREDIQTRLCVLSGRLERPDCPEITPGLV